MERVDSFDYLKGIALFFVVLIHVKPFVGMQSYFDQFGIFLLSLSRFAVPCFFLIAGYLFSKKLKESDGFEYVFKYVDNLARNYGKASLIFLTLNLILLVLNNLLQMPAIEHAIILDIYGFEGIVGFLYLGDAVSYHLWFIPALIISTVIVYSFQELEKTSYLVVISLILNLLGSVSNAYGVNLGINIPLVDPLFFGLFYTAAGFFVAEKRYENVLSPRTSLTLFTLFLVSHSVEWLYILSNLSAVDIGSLSYSFSTIPMSLALFLFVLAKPKLGRSKRLAEYGRNSLWIYILHAIPVFVFLALHELILMRFNMAAIFEASTELLVTFLSFFTTAELVMRYKEG